MRLASGKDGACGAFLDEKLEFSFKENYMPPLIGMHPLVGATRVDNMINLLNELIPLLGVSDISA